MLGTVKPIGELPSAASQATSAALCGSVTIP